MHAAGGGRRCYFLPSKLQMLQSLLSRRGRHAPKCEATRFTTNETNQTLSPESLRASCQRLAPTRCYGSGAPPALSQPASLARGRLARNQPTEHRQRRAFHHTKTSNGQHYVLIRTAGSARSADEAAAAEDGRWWFELGSLARAAAPSPSIPRGRRAHPRRPGAGRRTPRFSAMDCGGRS